MLEQYNKYLLTKTIHLYGRVEAELLGTRHSNLLARHKLASNTIADLLLSPETDVIHGLRVPSALPQCKSPGYTTMTVASGFLVMKIPVQRT